MSFNSNKSLKDSLRKSYNAVIGLSLSSEDLQPPKSGKPKKQAKQNSSYSVFKEKYSKLSKYIDDFSTKELLYLFRQVAEDSGHKYVIANYKKDMAIFKKLKNNYTNREIWGMIDFLYNSEQDYLNKFRLSPNILVSSWCNTIYADSQLYIKGEFSAKPIKSNKRKKQLKKREWSGFSTDINSNIGEW